MTRQQQAVPFPCCNRTRPEPTAPEYCLQAFPWTKPRVRRRACPGRPFPGTRAESRARCNQPPQGQGQRGRTECDGELPQALLAQGCHASPCPCQPSHHQSRSPCACTSQHRPGRCHVVGRNDSKGERPFVALGAFAGDSSNCSSTTTWRARVILTGTAASRAHARTWGNTRLWRMGKRPPAGGVHTRVSTITIHGHCAEKASASCCHAAPAFSRRRCPHPKPHKLPGWSCRRGNFPRKKKTSKEQGQSFLNSLCAKQPEPAKRSLKPAHGGRRDRRGETHRYGQ